MKFPNAANGVKKLFTAEILALIAAIASVIGSAIGVAGLAAAANVDSKAGGLASLAGIGIVVIAASVLLIIGAVMSIVGIAQSAKDEPSFKTALIFMIVAFVLAIVANVFKTNANVLMYSIFYAISEICELCMTLFVIQGIMNLADKLNNSQVSNKGRTLFKIILCIYLFALIANILVAIFTSSTVVGAIALVLVIVSGILEVVEYIVFLTYLANAKKMLNE